MVKKLQQLKGKTKLGFYKKLSKNCDEMNIRRPSGTFQFEEDTCSKNAPGISKIYYEVLLLMKFLQTKPQILKMNNNSFDLYYTVLKNRDENEVVNDKYKNIEND